MSSPLQGILAACALTADREGRRNGSGRHEAGDPGLPGGGTEGDFGMSSGGRNEGPSRPGHVITAAGRAR